LHQVVGEGIVVVEYENQMLGAPRAFANQALLTDYTGEEAISDCRFQIADFGH
jgi:hypothetical protein